MLMANTKEFPVASRDINGWTPKLRIQKFQDG